VLTFEVIMVIIAVTGGLMGIIGTFFWNKIKGYDEQHKDVRREISEVDDRLSTRMNAIENRATAIESSTVTKEDLFNAISTINDQASKRDEKIYDKLETLSKKIEDLRYNSK